MSQNYITKVMESMGWTDGSFIPVANEENRKIMEEINQMMKNKENKFSESESMNFRVNNLGEHFKNTEEQIFQNLKLLEAYRSQLDSEKHIWKLSEHEESRFGQQKKDLEKSLAELTLQDDKTRNEVIKITSNINKLSEKIEWAKVALEEFRDLMSRGELTNQLIEKYCKEDASRAEILEAKRRIIQMNIIKQKNILIKGYEEQKSLEQVLERTAQLYRQAHFERRQMVSTWKEAVQQMNQRENDIKNSENDLEESKKISLQKSEELKEINEFLEQHLQNNKDMEKTISDLNKISSNTKTNLLELSEIVTLKTSEFSTIRKTLQNLSTKLNHQRNKNRQSLSDKQEKEVLLEKEISIIDELNEKLEKFTNRSFNAQERLKQLDEIMETEEKHISAVQAEISRLGSSLFRAQQQLYKMQTDEKNLIMESSALESGISSIKSSFKIKEKELQREIEIILNIDFQIQNLERRLNNMKGIGLATDPERDAKIEKLEKKLNRKTDEINLLQIQVAKVEDDMKKMTQSYNDDQLDFEKLSNRLKQRQMNCEGGEKIIKRQTVLNQEKLVEKSILKMRVNQMEKQIVKQDNKLYNLEKHRLELDFTMKERLSDIKLQRDVLFMKRKHLLEERNVLRADIGERSMKIHALKKRWENVVDLLGRNDDGSIISATQIKIKTAQEKYILLKEGNDLNDKVLTAEKDIKAMENTLRMMNYSNDSYKRTFQPVEEKSPQMIELKNLEEIYCQAVVRLKNCRSGFLHKSQQFDEMSQQKEDYEKIVEDAARMKMDTNDILMKVHKELMDQKVKHQRADRELKASIRSAKQKINDSDFMLIYEKYLNAKELEDRNTSALQQLADLVDNNLDMSPMVSSFLFEKGLSMPQISRTKSQTSWKSASNKSGSEYSIPMISASSRVSLSSSSSKNSAKSVTTPSIVLIDFPGENTIRSNLSKKPLRKL